MASGSNALPPRGNAWAILVAAGTGSRLGGDRPKAFVGLLGDPLLAESLERLDGSDWIDAHRRGRAPDWEEPAILLAEEIVASKVAAVVAGGATRAESVRMHSRRSPTRRSSCWCTTPHGRSSMTT